MRKSTASKIVLAAAVIGLGYLIRYKVAETHDAYWIAAGWLLTASIVLRVGLALRRAYAAVRTQAARAAGIEGVDQLTTAAMPSWVRGYYATEKRVYRGSWRTLCRRPLQPAGEFSVSNGPNGPRLLAVSLLALVLVAGLAAWSVALMAISIRAHVYAFLAIGLVATYAAIWLVGDRRSVREGGHAVSGGEVRIDLGIRCSGTVPLAGIAGCTQVAGDATPAGDTWTVSPSEAVNVLIELAAPAALDIVAFGYPRTRKVTFVALYVDQPARFAEAVARAAQRAVPRTA